MSDKPSTPTRERILEYIGLCIAQRGYPPTLAEIRRAVGIASDSTIAAHLDRLAAAGRLQRQPYIARGITLKLSSRDRSR